MIHSVPQVSIIIATFNRSNVLEYAIQSVVEQTFTDWEVLVVGDACTDDTAEVVRKFNDPRVTFINLPFNHGEQSAPNNEGLKLARGAYIAFLNHDDLWFDDHLECALKALEMTQSDLIWTLAIAVLPDGRLNLLGSDRSERYEAHMFVPASTWVFRKEMVSHVGPWHSATECYLSPSQDWLVRAASLNLKMRCSPTLTVLAIQSGNRPNSYRDRQYLEHQQYARELRHNIHYRQVLLTALAHDLSSGLYGHFEFSDLKMVRRKLFFWAARLFKFHPVIVWNWFRYGRKGAFLNHLRAIRGLAPMAAKRQK